MPTEEYEQGWVEITRALDSGASWSGRERNVAYLNLGQGRFADVSSISGLDQPDDGRSALQTDWDHDGAPDLWLRNRTGPQLRLFQGRRPAGDRWVSLELRGTTCNRDAVGARLTITTDSPGRGPSTLVREVTAGDGYLAQSSLRQHLALLAQEEIREVSIRWPGGVVEIFSGVRPGTHHLAVQGSGKAAPLIRTRHELQTGSLMRPGPAPARVVLRTPLPLPPTTRRAVGAAGAEKGAVLLNLWSVDCQPCLSELADLATEKVNLQEQGLRVIPLCVDTGDTAVRAGEFFDTRIKGLESRPIEPSTAALIQAVLAHCLGPGETGLLPTSLLVDEKGWLQVIYIGPMDVNNLIQDAKTYAPGPRGAEARETWPGRWFFGTPRDLMELSKHLAKGGHPVEARFYDLLHRRAPR